eukprot:scaffold118132_cov15-Prasinocladus_malaysianus.AAC.1
MDFSASYFAMRKLKEKIHTKRGLVACSFGLVQKLNNKIRLDRRHPVGPNWSTHPAQGNGEANTLL